MHMLKKGILLGLGLNNSNKKHIKDFVDDLYKKGYVGYDEAEELFKSLVAKAKNQRDATSAHMEDRIKNYIKEYDELIYEHLLYLERRVEQLEDEFERIQLEKELENMSDEDLEKLITEFESDLGKNKKIVKPTKEKNRKGADQDKLIDDVLSTEHNLDEKKLEELLFGKSGKSKKVKVVKNAKKKKVKKAKAPKVKKVIKKSEAVKKKKATKAAKMPKVKKISKKAKKKKTSKRKVEMVEVK